MFEGKHIHFSPLDNKPLCSYSSKLCRQRRLNGYAFCIRHILEDKSAPFKQCAFVTRNNYQKCLNAIPSNQDRGYCHSHMQVAGIIPKTERKPKVINNSAGGTSGGSSTSNDSSSGASTISLQQSHNNKNKSSDGKIKSEEIGLSKELTNFSNNTKTNPNRNSTPNNSNINNLPLSSSSKATPSHKGKSYLAASSISSINSGLKKSAASDTTSLICGKINNNGSFNNNLSDHPKKLNTNNSIKSNQKTSTESQSSLVTVKKEPQRKVSNLNLNSKLISGEAIVPIHHQNLTINGNPKKKVQPLSYGKSSNGAVSGIDKSSLSNGSKTVFNSTTSNPTATASAVTVTTTNTATTATATTYPTGSCPASSTKPVSTLCVRDRWKSFKFLSQDSGDVDIKPARQLEQMKTIKILEKLPLFAEVSPISNNYTNKSDVKPFGCGSRGENGNRNNSIITSSGSNSNSANSIPISSGIEILLGPPFLSKTKLFSINKNKKNSLLSKAVVGCNENSNVLLKGEGLTGEGLEKVKIGKIPGNLVDVPTSNSNNNNGNNRFLKLQLQLQQDEENKKNEEDEEEDLLEPWEWESRKQFLKRVRTAFQRQYKTIRKACKLSEKQDKNDKSFRDALLTCAMSDSSLCAQILSTSDSKLDEICTVLLTSRKVVSENQSTYTVAIRDQQPRLSAVSRTNNKIQSKAGHNNNANNGVHSSVKNSTGGNGKVVSIKLSGGVETSRTLMGMNMKATSLNGDLTLHGSDDKSCITLSLNDNKDSFHNEMGISSAKSGNINSSFKLNSGPNCMWNNMDAEPKKLIARKKSNPNPNLKSTGLLKGMKSNCKSVVNLNGNKANGGHETLETGGPKKNKAKKTKATSSPSTLSSTQKKNVKKRKVTSMKEDVVSDMDFDGESTRQLNSKNIIVLHSDDSHNGHSHGHLLHDTLNSHEQLLGASSSVDFQAVSNLETVLSSVSSSSDAATTPEGVITDASFDSPFDHSTSSHPDCEFSDDDLEKSFELQIDPEIAHQASRLLEDNGLTEDDFNELFPETRMGDHKLIGRADLTDLGIDFTSNFDANDIDYSLFANIFPNFRSNQPESISVNHQF